MFYINKETVLTAELLQKLLNKFKLNEQPRLLKWKNYYDGKHKILEKSYADKSKPCNHIITNFCKNIAQTYNGYICGKPITYSSNNDITEVQKIINYNDSATEDMSFCLNALIYGVGYELQWVDNNAQVRYSQVNPLNAFAVFDNTLDSELLYFVRWYEADNVNDSQSFFVEVYDSYSKKIYKTKSIGNSLEFIREENHFFGDVPVSVFKLNENNENIFNCIISLNDAYNEVQSAEIDDYSAWVDSYLVLMGADADKDTITSMKENRVLILPEGASASWLTKNANDTQIVNILDNLKSNIYKITNCIDMTDEAFVGGVSSGTALSYKIVGFENVASGIVSNFKKAIQRRIELICNVLTLKADDTVWRDININFVRNLPPNLTEVIQAVNGFKGIVSDKTLLSQVPFVTDVQAELEAVRVQKEEEIQMYSFGTNTEDEDE